MKVKLAFLAITAAVGVAATSVPAATVWHFGLARSAPEADATVPSVDEVRMWFTQVPQEGSLSVRLVDPAGDLVETGELGNDPDDGKIAFLPIEQPLESGAYTVAWRGIGDDGHVVRGDFTFTVAAVR